MKNILILNKVERICDTIKYYYTIKGAWKRYFNRKIEFYVQYSENVEMVPEGICVIPFLTNFLPLIWVFDAELYIETIDKEFYDSIENFKKGYQKMYPNIKFRGTILAKNIQNNSYIPTENTAMFFSGGVDAFSTLITHIEEKPKLLTLWGSDINVNDKKSWDIVRKQIDKVRKEFDLEGVYIKTTFRDVIRNRMLDFYIRPKIKDGWWHGLQHGIAIIGHASPIAYKDKFKLIYIAASFTKKVHTACASDPTIDNYVKLSSTSIYHDGYNLERNEKIRKICQYSEEKGKNIKLRVCIGGNGDKNCCNCEKCYRTIMEIISEEKEPRNYGFDYEDDLYKKIEKDMNERILLRHTKNWERIKNNMLSKKNVFENDDRVKWILEYDFDKVNKPLIKYYNKIYYAIKKRFNFLRRKIVKNDEK